MCQTHNTKALNPSSFPSDHIFPFGRLLNQHQLQGRRREVSTGGGADSDWGGQIQVSQNYLPPNSYFSSDFAQFILEILKNLKILVYIQKFFSKNRYFWGTSPRILNRGRHTRPPIPPVATTMNSSHAVHFRW